MKVAFVDLLFSWPANGGADVDLYNVVDHLRQAGIEVRLFVAHEEGSSDRGRVSEAAVPFPLEVLRFRKGALRPRSLAKKVRNAVDAWEPDVVFLTHGYALKPHVAEALAHYPLVGRFYAHELLCAKDAGRFLHGKPCQNDYLRTPNTCRACALQHQRDALFALQRPTWTVEYLAARAYHPAFHGTTLDSLAAYDVVVVSNGEMRRSLQGYHEDVEVFRGGCDIDAIAVQPLKPKNRGERKVVLMSGRVEAPMKGLEVLLDAGRILEEERDDFEIWATHFDHALSHQWFTAIGWHSHEGSLALYGHADICVVPSVWEEPFGLVAVEAMAVGRPVCASRVGGLKEIVRHTETGFLFENQDARELAKGLSMLLDNSDLRRRMGEAGRRVVEREYTWPAIVQEQYLPLLERLVS